MRISGWLIIGLVGSAALLLGWMLLSVPAKITDPNGPRFDPMQFKFSDYQPKQWPDVLRKVFQPGDSRAKVEAILVKHAGAVPQLLFDKKFIRYNWEPAPKSINHYGVLVVYDDRDRTLGMTTTRGTVFNQSIIDDLIKQVAHDGQEYVKQLHQKETPSVRH